MKFSYVDESGDEGQSDVFVIVGIMIDAYRLRKHTVNFDEMLADFLARHPGAPNELKTKAFINGNGGWSQVDAEDRKRFLTEICNLAAKCARIFGIALSLAAFKKVANDKLPFGKSHWLSGAMFIAALVQKKMQNESRNKGMTVLICDDNKKEMAKLADALFKPDAWFDPIYQKSKRKKGWLSVSDDKRFDQIINCAFAIKSEHSSLIQIADAVAYVYRRHLELKSEEEAWKGEQSYFAGLIEKLEPQRELLGRNPGGDCIIFYEAASHKDWKL